MHMVECELNAEAILRVTLHFSPRFLAGRDVLVFHTAPHELIGVTSWVTDPC